jgi:hypothetical protein
MSPTLERMIVLRWLVLLDTRLPNLVQRYFSHELRTRTLKDLQPQICDALDDLLKDSETTTVNAIGSAPWKGNKRPFRKPRKQFSSDHPTRKQFSFDQPQKQFGYDHNRKLKCPICKKTGQQARHPITECPQLTQSDKQDIIQAFSIQLEDASSNTSDSDTEDQGTKE